ncbi:MAG: transposase [Polyangiaceae bacterium]|nr:transposase [Polyangiaceae bacterium]
MRILDETDRAGEKGVDIGAILRREALYSSHLAQWRKEREGGTLAALSKKRGPKPKKNPLADEVERLRKELASVKRQLAQAEVIIDVQKKVASLLGIPLKTPDDDESAS